MTDETAKAILACDKDELFYYEPPSVAQEQNGVSGFSPLLGVDVTALKQMARLWLMRDEIIAEMNDAGASAHGCSQAFYDLLDKITAIAGESKDG